MKKTNITIGVVLLLVVGLLMLWLGYNVYCGWCLIQGTFFNVRLIEIVQAIMPIIIAILITYIITNRVHNESKQKDIVLDIADRLMKSIEEIMGSGRKYVDVPDKQLSESILIKFKTASELVTLIGTIMNLNRHKEAVNQLTVSFIKYKKSITNSPFGSSSPKYSKYQKNVIDDSYARLINVICQLKIYIYS